MAKCLKCKKKVKKKHNYKCQPCYKKKADERKVELEREQLKEAVKKGLKGVLSRGVCVGETEYKTVYAESAIQGSSDDLQHILGDSPEWSKKSSIYSDDRKSERDLDIILE